MKILFITHETSRTGAPMVLLHFLKWLKVNKPEVVVDVLALEGGAMESDFKSNCNRYFNFNELIMSKPLTIWQLLLLKLRLFKIIDYKAKAIRAFRNDGYQVVYANTVLSIPLASTIAAHSKSKLIAHIHELNVIIQQYLPNLKAYLPTINRIIVPSNLVKKNLMANWQVADSKIIEVYECSESKHLDDFKTDSKEKSFVIGASGLVHWRKGHDVFIQVARYIKTHYPEANVKFVWVGRIPEKEQATVEADLKKLSLQDIVTFIGEVEHPMGYYKNFDVFVMTSREDPFPLVCIEVGMLGKPIVSFEQATGTNEIIGSDGGFIVPYLNIEAMSDKIMMYYSNKALIKVHGDYNKVAFSKFTPNIICKQLFDVIVEIYNKPIEP